MTFTDFVKSIYGPRQSTFTCVLGKNETGKTDLNLLIMEKLHDLGIYHAFGSNMRSLEADFEIEFIEDFKTLEQRCRMLNPNPNKYGLKKYLFFGSEIGKWAPKDQAWKNVALIEKLQTVRKYGLSMLTDAIDRVDARVLSPRFFAGEFEKKTKKHAFYTDYKTGERITLIDIPRTKIKFDTFETANFYMEPQTDNLIAGSLTPELEIAKKWLEFGSWKKAGIHTEKGKRAIKKSLELLFSLLGTIDHKELEQEIQKAFPIEENSAVS